MVSSREACLGKATFGDQKIKRGSVPPANGRSAVYGEAHVGQCEPALRLDDRDLAKPSSGAALFCALRLRLIGPFSTR